MKTPYLKFNQEKLVENYHNFNSVCNKFFPKNKICFSVKTNTNKEVINTLEKLKSGFEVASLREIKLTPKNLFRTMNGPAKTTEELKEAINNKILIFIDSFSELEKINELKNKNPDLPKSILGIRLGNKNSKFGFSDKQLKEVFKKAKENKLEIQAIQLHQGTLNKFSEFKKSLMEQKKKITPFMKTIKYLDLGGGYPDNFQLKNLSLKLVDYMEEIKKTFKTFKGTFIFEPGRNLVADTYALITKVVVIKEKDNETYAILDAGVNILSKITLANFKFNKLAPKSIKSELKIIKSEIKDNPAKTYTLAGPLLFGNDILGKWHGKLIEGDYFEVENVGAYCENLAWDIIYDKPRVL